MAQPRPWRMVKTTRVTGVFSLRGAVHRRSYRILPFVLLVRDMRAGFAVMCGGDL